MIDLKKPNFGGVPIAPWRPRMDAAPADPAAEPIVSVITAVRDAHLELLDTAESLLGQSFQSFEWIVVDDRSPDADARAILDLLPTRDPRIRVVSHLAPLGRAAALDTGVAASEAPYVYLLDAGCQIEATALEKSVWALESHADWSFVSGWSVAFGAAYFVWQRGFESPAALCEGNPCRGPAVIRRSAFEAAGGFDESLRDGAEDWDLWLRCAEAGLWGGTIAEPLDWFAAEDATDPDVAARLRAFRARLDPRLARLAPLETPRSADRTEEHLEELPMLNRLALRTKRLLVVAWSLASDGPGALLIDALAALKKQGWRVTFACVEMRDADAATSIGRQSCDVHVLGRFLRAADQPRYLRYLVESRSPEWILFGAGRFGHASGSYLRARCAGPRFAELRHLDTNDPDAADVAAGGAGPNPFVDLCLSTDPADAARRDVSRVVPIAPAIDPGFWKPRQPPREWMRPQWDAAADDTVVAFVERLDDAHEADAISATLRELVDRDAPVRLVVAAEGAAIAHLMARLRDLGLGDRARFLGPQSPDSLIRVLSASDVLLARRAPVLSIAALRAMACELPVVPLSERDEIDGAGAKPRTADRIEELSRDGALRRALGRAAREQVLGEHGTADLLQRLLEALDTDGPTPREPAPTPDAYRSTVAFFESAGRASR